MLWSSVEYENGHKTTALLRGEILTVPLGSEPGRWSVIRLACPRVIGLIDTGTQCETPEREHIDGQVYCEHASGNGASGRGGLDLLPTFVDMTKVGPGEQGVETTPLESIRCQSKEEGRYGTRAERLSAYRRERNEGYSA